MPSVNLHLARVLLCSCDFSIVAGKRKRESGGEPEHHRHLKAQTRAAAPWLVEAVGVGLDIAAEMLVTAGDNSDRVRSESAFAKLCGASPIPAGSGKTSGRHRLNSGGNRQANAALYRAVIVGMRCHQPTIDYVARRTAEGHSAPFGPGGVRAAGPGSWPGSHGSRGSLDLRDREEGIASCAHFVPE